MPSRDDPKGMRDLRAYSHTTQARLIGGGLVLILIVGISLIFLLYGGQAAIMGLLCILVGLAPVLIVVLWLVGFEKIVESWRARE